jgi:hypothetical protein
MIRTLAARVRTSWGREPIDWNRSLTIVAIAAFLVAIARAVAYLLLLPSAESSVGNDYQLYVGAAERWVATGVFYQPFQLAGPYQVMGAGEILYPPIILLLLIPFTVLPGILWWIVPLGLTAWAVARLRPAPWSLTLIGLISVTHAVQAPFFWGTPVIWLLPAVAWGFLLGWPAVVVFLKPTLAPFALAGLTHPRSLIFGCLGFTLLALPFGSLWFDWLTAIRNSDLAVSYALTQNLLLVIPVVAWFGRTRAAGSGDAIFAQNANRLKAP